MAECIAFPSIFKLKGHRHDSDEKLLSIKTLHLPARSCTDSKVGSSSICKTSIVPSLSILNRNSKQETCSRYYCRSVLAYADGAIAYEWVPFTDQVLFLASITLKYMAGVIHSQKTRLNSPKSISFDMDPENSSSGSTRTNQEEVYLQFAWDVVKQKLMESSSIPRERFVQLEQNPAKQPLSLCAVAEGPRLRLLWASYQWLNKEVEKISTNSSTKSTSEVLSIFAEIIQNCCRPLCMAWLEAELCLISRKPDKELFSLAESKLNEFESIIQNIRKSGKENLYSELVYALKFGPYRKGGYYNGSLYIQHGVAILEDLLITLADGIASMYLELISVDCSLSNEMNNLGLNLCKLSTRALQKLRNEVALQQWLHQNMAAVASMYDDQFDLCTLHIQLIEETNSNGATNFLWWKKLIQSGSVASSSCSVEIKCISVPVKRTKELRALTGWRYYYSLILELSDITMPFVKTVVAKVTDAISFFLVCLIGRSLGLIYSGIRNSLRLK